MNHEKRARAARALLNLSALSGHIHVTRCVDSDGSVVNWDTLEEWNWSSGERVLIELLRVTLLGHGHVRVQDLFTLDDRNRAVAAMAISTLFGVGDEDGWE